MPATYIFTKAGLIDMINRDIKDDEMVVLSTNLSGTLSFSKKKGTILPFKFAADALNVDGVGHIVFGNTTGMAIMIVKKDLLSEKSLKALLD